MKTMLNLLLALVLPAALSAETINLGAGRSARLNLPDAWKAAKVLQGLPENPAGPANVRYVTKNGSNDAVLLSLIPMADEQYADLAQLRALVKESTQQFADGSMERKANLKEIKVDGRTGFSCLFTDAELVGQPTKKDDYKTITSCFVYLGDNIMLAATIFSDDPGAKAYDEATRLLQSLTLSTPQKPI